MVVGVTYCGAWSSAFGFFRAFFFRLMSFGGAGGKSSYKVPLGSEETQAPRFWTLAGKGKEKIQRGTRSRKGGTFVRRMSWRNVGELYYSEKLTPSARCEIQGEIWLRKAAGLGQRNIICMGIWSGNCVSSIYIFLVRAAPPVGSKIDRIEQPFLPRPD